MGKRPMHEQILRASKEIAVKFIEVGRLSPGSFPETFETIYKAIDTTVQGAQINDTPPSEEDQQGT